MERKISESLEVEYLSVPTPCTGDRISRTRSGFRLLWCGWGVESPNYSLEQCRTPWTLESAPFLCCEDSKGTQASPTHPCLRVESFWTKRTPHPSQQWLPQNLESCASCIYQTLKLEVCQVYWSCRTWVPTGLRSLHEQLCLTYKIHLFPFFKQL